MRTYRISFFLIFFYAFISESFSQQYQFSSHNKKAIKYYKIAEESYKQRQFDVSAENLHKSLQVDSQFIEAWLLRGDALSELKQTASAIEAYQKAVGIDPEFFPPVYYLLGNLFFINGNYELAIAQYEKFLQFESITENQKKLALIGLNKAKFASYEVNHPKPSMPENIFEPTNTAADEYVNFVNEYQDEMLLTRKQLVSADIFSEKIYHCFKEKEKWLTPEELKLSWQQCLDLGGMSLSVDGRKMYFTGCNWEMSYGSCDIFISFKTGKNWDEPMNAGMEINSQWWDSQPVVTADGKTLFFASKRAGGKGGSDIWKSIRLKNGKWSQPLNLGDSINSVGDEMAPFIHADGKSLFFSSNGWPGLGGYDLFLSKADETGRWLKASNLGFPVNSQTDEINIFISIDGKNAWLSSNRKGGMGGFDIYSFLTFDEIEPQNVYFIKGIVKDKENGKLLVAKIQLTNLLTGIIEDSVYSDMENGTFLLVLHPGIDYAFNISGKGYLFYSENFNLKDDNQARSVNKDFELTPVKKGNTLVLNNIFFDFNSSNLKPASLPELNKLVEFLSNNKDIRAQISGHTDNIGNEEYNFQLSTDRAKAVFDFLIEKGINPHQVEYKGFGSLQPIETNETESGRATNRRTEVLIL